MKRKRFTQEPIIHKLREVEVTLSKGGHHSPGGKEDRGDRSHLLPVAG